MTPTADSDRLMLEHILYCVQQIREYTENNQETFFGSRMVQDATVRNLQVLAESTQRLSESIKATRQDIPWRKIAGFRNVLVHSYLGIDLEAVWSVVEHNLEDLSEAAEEMLLIVNKDIEP